MKRIKQWITGMLFIMLLSGVCLNTDSRVFAAGSETKIYGTGENLSVTGGWEGKMINKLLDFNNVTNLKISYTATCPKHNTDVYTKFYLYLIDEKGIEHQLDKYERSLPMKGSESLEKNIDVSGYKEKYFVKYKIATKGIGSISIKNMSLISDGAVSSEAATETIFEMTSEGTAGKYGQGSQMMDSYNDRWTCWNSNETKKTYTSKESFAQYHYFTVYHALNAYANNASGTLQMSIGKKALNDGECKTYSGNNSGNFERILKKSHGPYASGTYSKNSTTKSISNTGEGYLNIYTSSSAKNGEIMIPYKIVASKVSDADAFYVGELQDLTVQKGETYSLSINAQSPKAVTYSWQESSDGESYNLTGQNTASYSATAGEVGTIYLKCLVTSNNITVERYAKVTVTDSLYTITWDSQGGDLNDHAASEWSLSKGSPIGELPTATRENYSFAGWYTQALQKGYKISSETVPTGDTVYYAGWTANEVTISFDSNGGSQVADQVKSIGKEFGVLPDSVKKGYTLEGWYSGKDGSGTKLTIKTLVPTLDTTYYAKWKALDYQISYNLNGGSLSAGKSNPIAYQAETESIVLNNPEKKGYTFAGWTGTGLENASTNVSIAKGSTGNRSYTATWVPTVYQISYSLNGGELQSGSPSTYTIESEIITLRNPSKAGYTFAGWTGTGLENANINVSIVKGSTGNRSYTATWIPTVYQINYSLNGGESQSGNPSTYTIESEIITLQNPSKVGYTFAGWTGTGIGSTSANVTIPKGSIGNRSYIATWVPEIYQITYKLNGGELQSGNPSTYTIESEKFTLNNPYRVGYTFAGWTGTGIENASTNVSILNGSIGNRSYMAAWIPLTYTISYDLNGGIVVGNNPVSYTIEESFSLYNPSRKGYTFAGWTGTGLNGSSMNVKVLEGSSGNRSYIATWNENEYQLVFDKNNPNSSGIMKDMCLKYTQTEKLPKNQYQNEDMTFLEWNTKSDGTGEVYKEEESISKLAKNPNQKIILYAQWKEKSQTGISAEYALPMTQEVQIDKKKVTITIHYDNGTESYVNGDAEGITYKNTIRETLTETTALNLLVTDQDGKEDKSKAQGIFFNGNPNTFLVMYDGMRCSMKVIRKVIMGDTNFDGVVMGNEDKVSGDKNDQFSLTQNNVRNTKKELTGLARLVADVNDDGNVNVCDTVGVKNIIMEK